MTRSFPSAVALVITLAAPSLATAAQPLDLTNQVFVERMKVTADGQTKISLAEPSKIQPGDQLVFVLNYHNPNSTASRNLFVTNPLPPAVIYQHASKGAAVSVDGGKNWGTLGRLSVVGADGKRRSARSDDVTHIRWQLDQPIPAGGAGKLTFRGVVR